MTKFRWHHHNGNTYWSFNPNFLDQVGRFMAAMQLSQVEWKFWLESYLKADSQKMKMETLLQSRSLSIFFSSGRFVTHSLYEPFILRKCKGVWFGVWHVNLNKLNFPVPFIKILYHHHIKRIKMFILSTYIGTWNKIIIWLLAQNWHKVRKKRCKGTSEKA